MQSQVDLHNMYTSVKRKTHVLDAPRGDMIPMTGITRMKGVTTVERWATIRRLVGVRSPKEGRPATQFIT